MEFKPETIGLTEKPDKKREELKGKVLSLKDLVDYQDGSVASRMIIIGRQGASPCSRSTRTKACPSIPHPTMPMLLFLRVSAKSGSRGRHCR